MELRVIIAGSRDFNDYDVLEDKVDEFFLDFFKHNSDKGFSRIKIISGTARGTDRLGERYAEACGYEVVRFPAEWDKLGKRAGVVRNAEMAKYASEGEHCGVLVVFWDGKSKGTEHMINIAKEYGLQIYFNSIKKQDTFVEK